MTRRLGTPGMPPDRLAALVEAGVALSETLDLRVVLKRIVRIACRVVGARYGALGVLDDAGTGLAQFHYHGLTKAEADGIGEAPKGRGLLAALITDARPLRLADITLDARSHGFPANHPRMRTFLGVPITSRGRVFGNLYLTEKRDGVEFTPADQMLAEALARHAGVAIENARLYAQAREGEETARRRAKELTAARAREQQKSELLRRTITTLEDERRRISRDLHDSAGQALASVLLGLSVAERASNLPDIRARIADLRRITADAVAQTRRIALELRPTVLDDVGLPDALERLARGFESRTAVRTLLRVVGFDDRLPPTVETGVYRIAQESLTNVARHAGARTVRILLQRHDGTVRLRVRDDGVGFDPHGNGTPRLGMSGIRERAELIGGTVAVRSVRGRGTTIVLEVAI